MSVSKAKQVTALLSRFISSQLVVPQAICQRPDGLAGRQNSRLRHRCRQRQRVQDVAHPPAERIINHLMLLDAALADK